MDKLQDFTSLFNEPVCEILSITSPEVGTFVLSLNYTAQKEFGILGQFIVSPDYSVKYLNCHFVFCGTFHMTFIAYPCTCLYAPISR